MLNAGIVRHLARKKEPVTQNQPSPIAYVLGQSVVSRSTQGVGKVPSGSTPNAQEGP